MDLSIGITNIVNFLSKTALVMSRIENFILILAKFGKKIAILSQKSTLSCVDFYLLSSTHLGDLLGAFFLYAFFAKFLFCILFRSVFT